MAVSQVADSTAVVSLADAGNTEHNNCKFEQGLCSCSFLCDSDWMGNYNNVPAWFPNADFAESVEGGALRHGYGIALKVFNGVVPVIDLDEQ